MTVLTLCEKCKLKYDGSYITKQTDIAPKKKCDSCGKPERFMKAYVLTVRRK